MNNKISIMIAIFLLIVFICSSIIAGIASIQDRTPINTYESSLDDMSIAYDRDNYQYIVEIGDRVLIIPIKDTEIIVSQETEVIVYEYRHKARMIFYFDPYEE